MTGSPNPQALSSVLVPAANLDTHSACRRRIFCTNTEPMIALPGFMIFSTCHSNMAATNLCAGRCLKGSVALCSMPALAPGGTFLFTPAARKSLESISAPPELLLSTTLAGRRRLPCHSEIEPNRQRPTPLQCVNLTRPVRGLILRRSLTVHDPQLAF
jgi:hypothetical protein